MELKTICLSFVVCFSVAATSISTDGKVSIPAPDILLAEHASLNSIRVTWNSSIHDVNTSRHLTYHVVLAESKCDQPEQYKTLKYNKEEWTFWGVQVAKPYLLCVQQTVYDQLSPWASIKVTPDIRIPPSVTDFGVIRHHLLFSGEDSNTYYFIPDEDISIKCRTSGSPLPSVTWLRDEQELVIGEDGVSWDNVSGVLQISYVKSEHGGVYRCVATNKYGKAQSGSQHLVQAVIHPFPPDEQDRILSVAPGDSFELDCRAPHSVPKPHISWSKIKSRTDPGDPEPVLPNYRITMGDDGNLLFLATMRADAGTYRCEVFNTELNQQEIGSYTTLKLVGREGFGRKPRIMKRSSEYPHSLVGGEVTIQCVFGGRPVPSVLWYRHQGEFPTKRHVFRDENRTLTILNVTREDEGEYQCVGRSSGHSSEPVKFTLLVHESPVWKKMPSAVNATVGDDVRYECDGDGMPPPDIKWLINGDPVADDMLSGRLSLGSDEKSLTIRNVQKSDLLNVQCNISNVHGYIFSDAYLNVYIPMQLVETPGDQVLEAGTVHTFPCVVTADPGTALDITWLRSGNLIGYEFPRIYVDVEHSLVINTSAEEDGGRSFLATYACVARNGISQLMAEARLKPDSEGLLSAGEFAPVMDGHHPTDKELLWIGLTSGLAALVIMCLIMLLVVRRRHSLMVRSGTDTSILTYLSAASRVDEERAGAEKHPVEKADENLIEKGLALDGSDFPGLRYLDDDHLQTALQEVFLPRTRIDCGDLVGKGHFGRVYAATMKDMRGKLSGRVAVKTLKYKPDETEIMELFLREALMMKDFRHPHVLSLIGISVDDDGSPMVILPFMSNGDLRHYIQDPAREITVLELLKMGLQVARGMVYLGAMRFVHRDLAARNCMVDSHRVVKVADFGLSRDLFCRDYYRIGDGKTPLPVRWMAPESLEASVFTTHSDVWSFGVLLWELMTRGAVPYPDIDNWDITGYIHSGKRLAQPLYCPDSVYEIMQRCWSDDSDMRPPFEHIVRDIESIVNSATNVDSSASHLYININTMVAVADYRDVSV